jgi:ABC-type proline/glycine betaine transport system ATPase subunit
LQKSLGITAIYVTHDQEEAMSVSDRIALMNAGRLEQVGVPVDIYRHPVSRFAAEFMGTTNLVARPLGLPRRSGVAAARGAALRRRRAAELAGSRARSRGRDAGPDRALDVQLADGTSSRPTCSTRRSRAAAGRRVTLAYDPRG